MPKEKTKEPKIRQPSESQIQIAFMEWMALKYPKIFPYAFHIPNEGKRSIQTGGHLRRQGLKKGAPDIMVAYPHNSRPGFFMEIKRATGKVSTEQLEFLQRLTNVGYICAVAFSVEEAINSFTWYMEQSNVQQ